MFLCVEEWINLTLLLLAFWDHPFQTLVITNFNVLACLTRAWMAQDIWWRHWPCLRCSLKHIQHLTSLMFGGSPYPHLCYPFNPMKLNIIVCTFTIWASSSWIFISSFFIPIRTMKISWDGYTLKLWILVCFVYHVHEVMKVSWFEHWFAWHEFQNHFTNAYVDQLKHMGDSLCFCSLNNNPLLCIVLNMLKRFLNIPKINPHLPLHARLFFIC